MKDSLAEALLGQVMGWDGTDIATSNTLLSLQMLASHKYDGYERFRPGRKFMESLAIWLRQFPTVDERRTALAFVRRRLIFISNNEMEQLVEVLYPKVIRPILRGYVSTKLGIPKYAVHGIENSPEFARARRQSLFLGLSDGARMDEFRRSNRDLSTEQVYATYEVSEPRLVEMRSQLLGCVDISPQPDESGSEMKEAKVSGVQLLKPGEDPAIVLYLVDEAFHQMTLPV